MSCYLESQKPVCLLLNQPPPPTASDDDDLKKMRRISSCQLNHSVQQVLLLHTHTLNKMNLTSPHNHHDDGKNPTSSSSLLLLLLVDVILWTVLVPVLALPVVFFLTLKTLVVAGARVWRPDLQPISPNDLMVARNSVQVKSIMDIGFVVKVKSVSSVVTVQELRETFSKLFLQKTTKSSSGGGDPYRSLRCTFEFFCGYLFNKEVSHVPTDKLIYQDHLNAKDESPESYFSRWFHGAYRNNELPRWEMVLLTSSAGSLEEVDEENCYYIGFRMHHGLIDGFGMILILDKLCGDVQSPYLVPYEQPPSTMDNLKLLFGFPRALVEYWVRGHMEEWPSLPQDDDESSSGGGPPSTMYLSWGTFDLDKLKRARRGLGVSFSTLLCTLQTGAMRRLLQHTGRGHLVTPKLAIFNTIPKPNHPRTTLTNHWSYVKVSVPFGEEDAVVRAKETETRCSSFVKSKLNVASEQFFLGFLNLLPTKVADWVFDLNTQFTAIKASCSSMVRAPVPYKLFGVHPVQNIFHTFCTKDLSTQTVLYMTTASHNVAQIDVTLTAAPALVNHSQKVANDLVNVHLRNELEDILHKLSSSSRSSSSSCTSPQPSS